VAKRLRLKTNNSDDSFQEISGLVGMISEGTIERRTEEEYSGPKLVDVRTHLHCLPLTLVPPSVLILNSFSSGDWKAGHQDRTTSCVLLGKLLILKVLRRTKR
jgi:hypothetical protein